MTPEERIDAAYDAWLRAGGGCDPAGRVGRRDILQRLYAVARDIDAAARERAARVVEDGPYDFIIRSTLAAAIRADPAPGSQA